MNYHQSEDFKDAVRACAEKMHLREIFIEKDYWVTNVLKQLSQSKYATQVVFKGGTSLSKAYDCIYRFSEDIDLAIIPGEHSGAKLKALLKAVSTDITKGLTNIPGHALEVKLGRNRTTVYQYERKIESLDFGVVKDIILLEVNCFTNPVPSCMKQVQSYLGKYLQENDFKEDVEKYGLEPFDIQVLALERTFFEKLLSINRLSYEGIDKLKEKIRHFYDIYQLLQVPDFKERIFTLEYVEILDQALADDAANPTMEGEWKGKRLSSSPLFTELEATWSNLEPVYSSGLAELLMQGELPASKLVLAELKSIKDFLLTYDENNDKKKTGGDND
ncbi:MAG: nucleotidyl transferase AbiEii/AbiGii toxin family protein [Flavobacterium sp.]|nr:MAG: nucleotidyl transferase AbiEii/AbiGii toxin family protein [Flavobacterium sp.]